MSISRASSSPTPTACRSPASTPPTGCSNSSAASDIPLALSESRGWNPFPWPYRDDCVKFNALPILRPYHSTVPTPPPSGNQLIAALLEQAVKSGIKLTVLLTTGFTPLTDVLRARKELAAGIDRVIWMGGAINVARQSRSQDHRSDVANRHAEWNVFWDPFAAQDGLDMFAASTISRSTSPIRCRSPRSSWRR